MAVRNHVMKGELKHEPCIEANDFAKFHIDKRLHTPSSVGTFEYFDRNISRALWNSIPALIEAAWAKL